MADKNISALTQAESIGGEDLFVLEQNGEAKKLMRGLTRPLPRTHRREQRPL